MHLTMSKRCLPTSRSIRPTAAGEPAHGRLASDRSSLAVMAYKLEMLFKQVAKVLTSVTCGNAEEAQQLP